MPKELGDFNGYIIILCVIGIAILAWKSPFWCFNVFLIFNANKAKQPFLNEFSIVHHMFRYSDCGLCGILHDNMPSSPPQYGYSCNSCLSPIYVVEGFKKSFVHITNYKRFGIGLSPLNFIEHHQLVNWSLWLNFSKKWTYDFRIKKKIFNTSFLKFKSWKAKTTSKKLHSTWVAITYFSIISMSICKSGSQLIKA
jgi:hypothetical protein